MRGRQIDLRSKTTGAYAGAKEEDEEVLGSASALWRYPVKSMQGEELETVQVTERGFVGDRLYALIDTATGKVVSAKNPRKWPGIMNWSAAFKDSPRAGMDAPPVRIGLPDGASIMNNEPGFQAKVSSIFSRKVTLRSTPPATPSLEEYWPDIDGLAHREMVTDETMSLGTPGTFFDFSAIHLVTTSTLSTLQGAYPNGRFDIRRFRPNIVVETGEQEGFIENDWVGREVAVGDNILLEVLIPCPRCVMTTLPQGDLPQDSGILKTAAQQNSVMIQPGNQKKPSVGVYAKVLQGGHVRRGDTLRFV